MIINLGISPNFGTIGFEHSTLPMVMSVNCMEVYQRPEDVNTGCDPDNFPTQTYINKWVPLIIYSCLTSSRYPLSPSALLRVPRRLHKPKPHDVNERLQAAVSRANVDGDSLAPSVSLLWGFMLTCARSDSPFGLHLHLHRP